MKQQTDRHPAMSTLFNTGTGEHDPVAAATLNALPAAVFAISSDERITFMNHAAMRISGSGYPERQPPVWNEVLLPFKPFRKISRFYEAINKND